MLGWTAVLGVPFVMAIDRAFRHSNVMKIELRQSGRSAPCRVLALLLCATILQTVSKAQTEISVGDAPWDSVPNEDLAGLGGDLLTGDEIPGEGAWPPPEVNCGDPPAYDDVDESNEEFFDVESFDGEVDKPAGWKSGDAGGTQSELDPDTGENVIRVDQDVIEEALGGAAGDPAALSGAVAIVIWHELHHAPSGAPYDPPVSEDGCDHAGLNYWTLLKACREARRWRIVWEGSVPFDETAWGRFVGACIMAEWLRDLLDPAEPRGKDLVECCEELQADTDGMDPCTTIFPLPAGCPPVLPECPACDL